MALYNGEDKELSQGDVGSAKDGKVTVKEDVYRDFDIPGSQKSGRTLAYAAGTQVSEDDLKQEFEQMKAAEKGEPMRVPGDTDTAAAVSSAEDTPSPEEGGHLAQRSKHHEDQPDSDTVKAQRASAEKEPGLPGGDSGSGDKDDQKSSQPKGKAGQAASGKRD